MSNRDIHLANQYHESTKLTYIDHRTKPSAYKRYSALSSIPLPTDLSPPAVSTLESVAGTVQRVVFVPVGWRSTFPRSSQ
ncbi:hypothetical protein NKDENANG_02644 [Candidatus Entotheonellaceae bacterium PAL068K]